MNEFFAVDLDIGSAVISPEGCVEFGNRRPFGVEFGLWKIDGHTIAFLNGVPDHWPEAEAVRAEAVVALAGEPIVDGENVRLTAIVQKSQLAAPLLAAAAAVGAQGFGRLMVQPNSVFVAIGDDRFHLRVQFGDENDERWRVFVDRT